MYLEVYHESKKTLWDNFVSKSKNGTFLFNRDYMDYHDTRFQDYSLMVYDEKGRLIALLPANRNKEELVSHGGLTYGGFVTDKLMKTPKMLNLFDITLSYLYRNGFNKFVYKSIPYIYHKIPADEDRYALFLCNSRLTRRGVLTVVGREERESFQERRYRAIKKALKYDLSVRLTEDFEGYWYILTANLLKNYNTKPVHALNEITMLHSRFPDNIKLYGCYKATELLAGVVIYESERVAHVQYVAGSEAGKNSGGLDLIFDYLLNQVYLNKPFFDFGTSDERNGLYLNQGLIDQKEGFGARAVIHDHYEIQLSEWQPGQILRVLEDE